MTLIIVIIFILCVILYGIFKHVFDKLDDLEFDLDDLKGRQDAAEETIERYEAIAAEKELPSDWECEHMTKEEAAMWLARNKREEAFKK
jgi:hypothetical protein